MALLRLLLKEKSLHLRGSQFILSLTRWTSYLAFLSLGFLSCKMGAGWQGIAKIRNDTGDTAAQGRWLVLINGRWGTLRRWRAATQKQCISFSSACRAGQAQDKLSVPGVAAERVGFLHSTSSVEVEWHFWNALIDTFSHKNKIK